MKILITSAGSRLSKELAASLSGSHEVVLTDRVEVSTPHKFVRSDLGHDESTDDLVKGVEAIVHSGEPDPDADVSAQLDVAMRCTYNLLWAASEQRVPRFIYLSSLAILNKYGEDLAVTESWRPVPTTDARDLSHHLGEYVCREFARERKIDIVCLRLGDLTWDESGAASSSALYPDDASQAVSKALTSDATGWDIIHIQSAVPNARYLIKAARESLGYSPAPR